MSTRYSKLVRDHHTRYTTIPSLVDPGREHQPFTGVSWPLLAKKNRPARLHCDFLHYPIRSSKQRGSWVVRCTITGLHPLAASSRPVKQAFIDTRFGYTSEYYSLSFCCTYYSSTTNLALHHLQPSSIMFSQQWGAPSKKRGRDDEDGDVAIGGTEGFTEHRNVCWLA